MTNAATTDAQRVPGRARRPDADGAESGDAASFHHSTAEPSR
jgi:hypothetical protein